SKGDAIDDILAKTDDAFAGFDNTTMAKIGGVLPGLAEGQTQELFERLQSLRELANTYKQKSTFMEEGRRMLSDVSEGANNFSRKLIPQAQPAGPVRRPAPKRQ